MSLKAFHVFFIGCSILLTIGFGVWGIRSCATGGGTGNGILGTLSLVAAAALVVYGIAFLRKHRDVGFF